MGNTANNNWPYPESTDLVKDGATAIENLADAIDTTLGVFVPSSPGLTLINTTSFSAVSSVSLPASTFSATYRNYKIIGHFLNSVSDGRLDLRLRASGSDNTTSNYSSGQIASLFSASLSNAGSTSQNIWNNAGLCKSNTVPATFSYEIYSPFETENTNFTCWNTRGSSGQILSNGLFNATTSFDSLSFIPEGGTITGTLYAFGYAE
jgi:hypothetical protein